MQKFNEVFMLKAFEQAKIARKLNEVPVGAVIVMNNKVIGKGYNKVIQDLNIASHAEINAIRDASNFLQNFRLVGCHLYVTLEPCHMCAKAIVDARLDTIFFSTPEPKTGAIISIDNFFNQEHLNHKVKFQHGFFKEKSALMLKNFFEEKR